MEDCRWSQMAGQHSIRNPKNEPSYCRAGEQQTKVPNPMITVSKVRKPTIRNRLRGLKIQINPTSGANRVSSTEITRKRIFIVDDHPAYRLGLAAILGTEFDLEICGEAADAEMALMAIADAQPDLVLTDISMPDVSGVELIRLLRETVPGVKVLAMSVHEDSVYALPVRQAGGQGYLNKETPADQIVVAIRRVLAGGMAFRQQDLMEDRRRGLPEREASGMVAGIEFLTARELEVFELLGAGHRTREVAEELGMSIKTAEVHRSNIRRKLGFTSSAEMLHAAYRWTHEQG